LTDLSGIKHVEEMGLK